MTIWNNYSPPIGEHLMDHAENEQTGEFTKLGEFAWGDVDFLTLSRGICHGDMSWGYPLVI